MPKILLQRFTTGKYKKSLPFKLGLKFPDFSKLKPYVVWIHAGSVGESKAAIAFAEIAKKSLPDASIVFSSTTETGLEEVRRSMPFIDLSFYLPFDLPKIMKRYIKTMQPKLLVLVESDLWPNLIHLAKKFGAKTLLVNGKLSEKSFKRHMLLKKLSLKLLNDIDMCCLQSDEYKERFLKIGVGKEKLNVCGNLKFDTPIKKSDEKELNKFKAKFGILPQHRIITIGSTHHGEEEILLDALEPLFRKDRNIKVILVPRHPERFLEVETLLESRHFHFVKYSTNKEVTGCEKILLIDAMGLLNKCYEISEVAIVAGSYVKVGGHNLLEPIEFGVPVFFGPHIYGQKEMARLVSDAGIGARVEAPQLRNVIQSYLYTEKSNRLLREKCEQFLKSCKGTSQKCWIEAEKLINSIN